MELDYDKVTDSASENVFSRSSVLDSDPSLAVEIDGVSMLDIVAPSHGENRLKEVVIRAVILSNTMTRSPRFFLFTHFGIQLPIHLFFIG